MPAAEQPSGSSAPVEKVTPGAKRTCLPSLNTVKSLLRGDVAQLVRALRSHRRGRGFEPLHPHQTKTTLTGGFLFGMRSKGARSRVKNDPVDRLAAGERRREAAPHEVQAARRLRGDPLHPHQKRRMKSSDFGAFCLPKTHLVTHYITHSINIILPTPKSAQRASRPKESRRVPLSPSKKALTK